MRDVRLKDVAALAGVSTATVSRVLHGNGYVSARSRERVEKALRDSGYRLNVVAQELRRQRTITIGLILHGELSHPFVGEVVIGAQQAAAEQGFNVLLLNAHGNAETERECVESLLERRVDGIIFTTAVQAKNVALALGAGVRAVEIERRLCAAASAVVVDNQAAATEAMRHLTGLGHRRIGFIGEPFPDGADEGADIPRERFLAYREALASCGQPLDDSLIVLGRYPRERGGWGGLAAGTDYMRRLLAQAPSLTAVFAVSDLVAAGAMQALYAAGIRVPGQLSVVSFDDTFARYLSPPLTTVRQPMFDMGYKAAALAMGLISDPGAPGGVIEFCPTSLVIRETTAPAPSAALRGLSPAAGRDAGRGSRVEQGRHLVEGRHGVVHVRRGAGARDRRDDDG
jgi:DNA-binding LacI/PurR family transcriptional regulator